MCDGIGRSRSVSKPTIAQQQQQQQRRLQVRQVRVQVYHYSQDSRFPSWVDTEAESYHILLGQDTYELGFKSFVFV